MTAPGGDDLAAWIARRRAASQWRVEPIAFGQCAHWVLTDGVLRHASGRFFSVKGLCCVEGPPHLKGLGQPIIDQPEVGMLGFVVRRAASGWQWLLQAKTEPGNVGGTQIGPSVQATQSNYQQVHGGKPTPMIELFRTGQAVQRLFVDVEQSEQGDRFDGKYNRNVVVQVDPAFEAPADGAWRWFAASVVRAALARDFTLNTDTRSVLCCSDWSLLNDEGRPPFVRWEGLAGWGAGLLASFAAPLPHSGLDAARAKLAQARSAGPWRMRGVPLDALAGWHQTPMEYASDDPSIDPVVRMYRVHAADREVTDWCQPLLTNRAQGRAVLVCARRQGVLQFLLPPRTEPGFAERAQFGPSLLTGPGHANPPGLLAAIDDASSIEHLGVLQSDEGGRFKDSVARYQIVELTARQAAEFDPHGAWVTLSAIGAMTRLRGMMSNELRSCVSLLLAWC